MPLYGFLGFLWELLCTLWELCQAAWYWLGTCGSSLGIFLGRLGDVGCALGALTLAPRVAAP